MDSAEMQLIFYHWLVEVCDRNFYLAKKKVLGIGSKRDPLTTKLCIKTKKKLQYHIKIYQNAVAVVTNILLMMPL